jgi:hypothetical protein
MTTKHWSFLAALLFGLAFMEAGCASESQSAGTDGGGDGASADAGWYDAAFEAGPDDGQVDAELLDSDGDGVPDINDPCPADPNQWTDADGDGVCDEVDDDCPNDPNGWSDTNGDGLCNGDDDTDQDGITNGEEEVYGVDCAISNPLAADTDLDGIDDNDDPFPRDPFPEYILFRNDNGTIDLMLSNRDGTFQPPVEIGEQYGCTADATHNCPANSAYRYVAFVISDFDNNGAVDFVAIGDSDLSDPSNLRDLWWFWRSNDISSGSSTTFYQRLVDGNLDHWFGVTTADFTNDDRIDLLRMVRQPPTGYITDADLYSYENAGLIATATCAYTDLTANPNGCAFIRRHAANLGPVIGAQQWGVRYSRDAVDVDGDNFRDMVVYTYASGGNAQVPTYLLSGNGDGTFNVNSTALFTHNSGGCGNTPANSILFADFNSDDIGDIIMGLDDDGDAGSAWFYPGQINAGYSINFAACAEAFDIHPGCESGCADGPGSTGSARNFDFNFDGNQDVMAGKFYPNVSGPNSHTLLFLGNGNGTFQAWLVVRDFTNSLFGQYFAIPQRLCARFPISQP